MKKVEGLKKLEGLGLNTPTTWVLDPMKKGEEEEMDISLSLIRTLIEATWNRISLRTDTEDMMSPYDSERKGFHFPFFYDLPLKEALKIAAELSKQGWAVLFSETVKKEDCIVRGNMGLIKREGYIIEYISGAGTVREDASLVPHIIRAFSLGLLRMRIPTKITFPLVSVRIGLMDLVNVVSNIEEGLGEEEFILEFSFYPYAIGRKKKNLIFWELR